MPIIVGSRQDLTPLFQRLGYLSESRLYGLVSKNSYVMIRPPHLVPSQPILRTPPGPEGSNGSKRWVCRDRAK